MIIQHSQYNLCKYVFYSAYYSADIKKCLAMTENSTETQHYHENTTFLLHKFNGSYKYQQTLHQPFLCIHVCVYTCTFSTCVYRCFCVCTHAPMGVECVKPGIKAAAYSAQIESTGRLLREGRGATRSGRGQSAVNFSSDRKRAERKKKKTVLSVKNDWPFCQQKWGSGVWMTKMPLTGWKQMTTLNEQVKESPVPGNEAKLDSGDDFKMISTRCSSSRSKSRRAKQADCCSPEEYGWEKESLFVWTDENTTYRNCLGQIEIWMYV